MKLSNMGYLTKKITKLDETYPAQDILMQTNQLMQFTSGIYAYDHIPYLLEKNIKDIVTTVLTNYGCQLINLPILQSKSIWEESGRWETYLDSDTMFVVKTNKNDYCLAPTAEEAVVTYAKSHINSYKQLPKIFFQIGDKFRNEIRARGYLFRGRAFSMMDAYSFDVDQNALKESYQKMKTAYFEIFDRLGIKVVAVGADGGDISDDESEEFMAPSQIGDDTILVDQELKHGFNVEIQDKPNYKELLKMYNIDDVESLHAQKAVELGHIFQLKTKYSQPMQNNFMTKGGENIPTYMGCYGIGISRLTGYIYEESIVKQNDKIVGLSLPINLAPYLVYVIVKNDNEAKVKEAEKLYEELNARNIPSLYDDRDENIGTKIKDCLMLGVPYIAILGDKTEANYIELETTKNSNKEIIPTHDLLARLDTINIQRQELYR